MASLPNMPHAENCSRTGGRAAQAAATKRRHLRLMAIRALFLGSGHDPLAALFSITRQTLANWIKRFHEQGRDSLIGGRSDPPGPPYRNSSTPAKNPNYPNLPVRDF
ncbi:MAG: helix-turn-helix domain-containing protein [Deltaproteobacteria bacterium]|nr:helix-turn-helix domain-containing protein [Deltaproteobacteria bacterium]